MNNYSHKWRMWTKVVAYADLTTSILFLAFTLFCIFPAEIDEAIAWYIWLVVTMFVLLTMAHLWAVVLLIKATKEGRDAKEAYNLCYTYKIVFAITTLFNFIVKLAIGFYYILAIELMTRRIFYCVVHPFMTELETIVIGPPKHTKPLETV